MNYPDNINLSSLLPDSWLKYIDENHLNIVNNSLKSEIIKNKDSEFYPYDINNIFRIFQLCDLSNIKVVILGQDPYFSNKFQANGIAFSVNQNVPIPPSLKNIYKELNKTNSSDISSGDLSHWVSQGVFLLNASLTVKQKHPNSHEKIWRNFITHIIDIINQQSENIIFVAWGMSALNRYKSIDLNKHIIISSSHPSPLSCYKTDTPFINSNIFNKINDILKTQNKNEIIW
jgi:uracil-DNA glycosylase